MSEEEKKTTDDSQDASGKKYWLDNPKNINMLFWGLVIVCGLLLIAGIVGGFFFKIENTTGKYAAVGFVAFIVIVKLGQLLRLLIKRENNYYDE